MKIAHVVRRFVFQEWGGTENVIWNSALTLKKLGVESEILSTSALDKDGVETRNGITVRRFPYFYPYFPLPEHARREMDKKGGNPFSFKLYKYLLDNDFDIIHVHSGARIAEMGIGVAKKKGIPCVMSLHGGFVDIPQKEMQELIAPTAHKLPYGGIIERLLGWSKDLMAGVDGVICVGRNEYNKLSEKYPDKLVIYLPNGVDTKKFNRPQAELPDCRELWKIPKDDRLILCVSRIDYQKNQLQLVQLLGDLRKRGDNVHILLIGPITAKWYEEEIRLQARKMGVSEHLTVIPGLSPDDPLLIAAYKEADVFVLPSQHEPFGIVVLEAWSAGIPVIGSDIGGLGLLIKDGVNGLKFVQGNDESLLATYDRLFATEGLKEALVKQAAEDVEAYSWETVAQSLVGIYNKVKAAVAGETQ
ncbi:MAG: glycosyltransferase family 4 protein [Lentisphaeria bacterium]|nr:glycosyltransferase family 4 protein [Lentisphaeria bacterium]